MPALGRTAAVVLAAAVVSTGLALAAGAGALGQIPDARADSPDPVIAAVGDMACDPSSSSFKGGAGTASACAELRMSGAVVHDSTVQGVLGLGDYQYYCGDAHDWAVSYQPTWGRIDDRIDPIAGNHEYLTGSDPYGDTCPADNTIAANFFDYFGASAHPETAGHYSFDLGTWHLIGLNANCSKKNVGGCTATSAQTAWLSNDLATTTQPCVLAYWHQPLFTGQKAAVQKAYQPWWNLLYGAHADVVLNGHVHNYQRYPALSPTGVVGSAGITEYIVGTGGEAFQGISSSAKPYPSVYLRSFGYLRLTLGANGWTAEFVNPNGVVLDTSSGTCH